MVFGFRFLGYGKKMCAGNIGLAAGRFDSVPDANMAEVYFMARGYCFFVFFSGRCADKIEVFLSFLVVESL